MVQPQQVQFQPRQRIIDGVYSFLPPANHRRTDIQIRRPDFVPINSATSSNGKQYHDCGRLFNNALQRVKQSISAESKSISKVSPFPRSRCCRGTTSASCWLEWETHAPDHRRKKDNPVKWGKIDLAHIGNLEPFLEIAEDQLPIAVGIRHDPNLMSKSTTLPVNDSPNHNCRRLATYGSTRQGVHTQHNRCAALIIAAPPPPF